VPEKGTKVGPQKKRRKEITETKPGLMVTPKKLQKPGAKAIKWKCNSSSNKNRAQIEANNGQNSDYLWQRIERHLKQFKRDREIARERERERDNGRKRENVSLSWKCFRLKDFFAIVSK